MKPGTGALMAMIAFAGAGLAACQASAPASPTTADEPGTVAEKTTDPSRLLLESTHRAGETVDLAGQFQGWQGRCAGAPPLSRSDWMLETGQGCLFVNGKLPAELSPVAPARGIGREIRVTGRLRHDKDGRAYLENATTELR